MSFEQEFKQSLFTINESNFENSSLRLFKYQYDNCSLYQEFCNSLHKNPTNVSNIFQIPFLPIEFFKTHQVKTGNWEPQHVFKSSGTTVTGRSSHFVKDINFYLSVSKKIFEERYGSLENYEVIALLPSYQEQGDSSLIAMVDSFIQYSQGESGYFLGNDRKLLQLFKENRHPKQLLVGVSYALLDLIESESFNFSGIIMETGGMKGRRREITREELHSELKAGFKVDSIHSEYGMTELFSQAYAEKGQFKFPTWAKALIRDINDPFCYLEIGKTGGINIIDLANVNSCGFIETKDLGRCSTKTFEVLGRFDNSDIRGCNLMIQRNP